MGKQWKQCQTLFLGAPKSVQMVIPAMKLKDACSLGDLGSIPGSGGSPEEGNGNPLQFLPGESHGQRSLVGYSSRGRKESGMIELLHLRFHYSLEGKL